MNLIYNELHGERLCSTSVLYSFNNLGRQISCYNFKRLINLCLIVLCCFPKSLQANSEIVP
jgi:hypothetical protein